MAGLLREDIIVGNDRFETLRCGPRPEEAPTLVFLHDGLGSASLWRDFPEVASEATGCGALAYSRLGYGDSSPCALPRPVDYMEREASRSLPKIIASAGLDRFFLVGHSDGGSIALLYAMRNPGAGLMGVVTLAAHVFCEELTLSSIRAAKSIFESGNLRDKMVRHHGPNVDMAFAGWSGMWLDPAFASWDFRPDISLIKVPLLGIQGRNDEYGTEAQLTALTAAPNGRILLLEDCGHSPFRDKPAKTLDAIAGFIRENR